MYLAFYQLLPRDTRSEHNWLRLEGFTGILRTYRSDDSSASLCAPGFSSTCTILVFANISFILAATPPPTLPRPPRSAPPRHSRQGPRDGASKTSARLPPNAPPSHATSTPSSSPCWSPPTAASSPHPTPPPSPRSMWISVSHAFLADAGDLVGNEARAPPGCPTNPIEEPRDGEACGILTSLGSRPCLARAEDGKNGARDRNEELLVASPPTETKFYRTFCGDAV